MTLTVPVISVVISCYGRPERLCTLIAQLLAQDAATPSYEVIVVDDGAQRPVFPYLETIIDSTSVPIRCLRKSNGGVASARNFGASHASGEFLLFTDDDMSVPPTYVLTHFEIQSQYGPAAINCEFKWQVEGDNPAFLRWYERCYAHPMQGPSDLLEIQPGLFICKSGMMTGCNLSIRKVDFDRIGGFDDGYRGASCEDQDFSARLANEGFCRGLVCRNIVLTHVETHNSVFRLCQRIRRGAAETVRLVKRMRQRYGYNTAVERLNGPISLRNDPLKVIVKKFIKQIIALEPFLTVLLAIVWLLERIAPNSTMLNKCYEALTAAFFQKGWREGLRFHVHVEPLVFSAT
jgi:glycosyltransferase involved in cell wall biosynthesis